MGSGMHAWLRAVVVIDGANLVNGLATALSSADHKVPPWSVTPDLAHLEQVLGHFGIEVVRFEVSLPADPVALLGVEPNEHQRTVMLGTSLAWLHREQQRLGEDRVRLLRAAADGNAEIGVDAMCVLAAMRAAWAGEADGVVVVSQDLDVMVAQDYVDDVPIYVAGRFDARRRKDLRAQKRNWIDLRNWGMAGVGPADRRPAEAWPAVEVEHLPSDDGGQRVVLVADETTPVEVSSDLAAWAGRLATRREQGVAGTRVAAVVDPYDLSLAAARAIGLAKLPTPATVDALLAQLGWDAPAAQFAVVPNIERHFLQRVALDTPAGQAIAQRREDLRKLARKHDDGDDRTQAWRARLTVDRGGDGDPDLDKLEEKQAVTVLAADVLWCLTHTDLPVVVLSDRPELAYLLERLDGLGVDTSQRLTRIGIHTRPVRIDGPPSEVVEQADAAGLSTGTLTREDIHFVQLNQHLTAELISLERELHGPALAAGIHQELTRTDVDWRMVRYDLESAGAVLSPVNRPEVEAVFQRMLEIDCEIAERLRQGASVASSELQVDVTYDPGRPCAMPVFNASSARAVETDVAIVVEHQDGKVGIDTTRDGAADTYLPAWHAADAYEPDQEVLLRRVVGDGDGVRLVGPLHPIDDPAGKPDVVAYAGDGMARHVDDDRIGELHEIPGARHLERTPGEWLLAFPLRDGSFQALSTALPHLEKQRQATHAAT